jgi:2-hydroxy-4-carboxymuconate semialdehyde hemiacetal dehydrogenase
MRFCFVGYGSIARAHARALSGMDGVTFDVVVGPRPEPLAQFAAEFSFTAQTDDLEMALARPTVDAVLITSPSDVHAAQAAFALRAGKHVLVEIPLAMSLADAERVTRLAEETGKTLMVAHTQRFMPALIAARERVQAGLHVHHAVCRWFFLRRANVNWEGRRRSWTDNLLWHHSCHVVDAALWTTCADPVPGTIRGSAGPPHAQLGIPLDIEIGWQTTTGALVQIAMSYNSHRALHDYLFIGEQETLLFSSSRLLAVDDTDLLPTDARGGNPIAAQDAEFLAAVREGRRSSVDGRAVLPAMAVLQQVQDQIGR